MAPSQGIRSYLKTGTKILGDIVTTPEFLGAITTYETDDHAGATEIVTNFIDLHYPEYTGMIEFVVPLVVEAIRHMAQKVAKKEKALTEAGAV